MTLLLVDDDEIVRRFMAMILSRMGYTVLSASGPHEALRLLENSAGSIDLLISDVMMPGINGFQLADQIAVRHTGMRTLFMSGYPEDDLRQMAGVHAGDSFIEKPFLTGRLLDRVRWTLEDSGARRNA
jgi:DNA-binding response OmpR family regulator